MAIIDSPAPEEEAGRKRDEMMTGERMAVIAKKLDALDKSLYDDVMEIIQESREQAVEEYKRGEEAKRDADVETRSPHDKRRR